MNNQPFVTEENQYYYSSIQNFLYGPPLEVDPVGRNRVYTASRGEHEMLTLTRTMHSLTFAVALTECPGGQVGFIKFTTRRIVLHGKVMHIYPRPERRAFVVSGPIVRIQNLLPLREPPTNIT